MGLKDWMVLISPFFLSFFLSCESFNGFYWYDFDNLLSLFHFLFLFFFPTMRFASQAPRCIHAHTRTA